MTVENSNNNNRYPFTGPNSGPFQKLFDVTQQYFLNHSDLKPRFNIPPPPPSFLLYPSWKPHAAAAAAAVVAANVNSNNSGNIGSKYFPPPPPPDILSNYLSGQHMHTPLSNHFLSHHHGPSPEMIKFIDKIREEELNIKMKDKPEAKLCEDELWRKFNNLTTEMVITKSGRRMFPAFKVQLSGLDPKSKYVLAIEVAPCDDNRFKFHNGKWTLAGKADPESSRLVHIHCESPSSGEAWMQKAVWFNKVKLTNNPTDKDPQHLVLNSMHKYIMRLHIFRCDDTAKIQFCLYPEVFAFKTTEFIAVTAYQNDKITQLKIDNNPFAKGFRDNGSGRREKKRLKVQHTITSTSPDSPDDSDNESSIEKTASKSELINCNCGTGGTSSDHLSVSPGATINEDVDSNQNKGVHSNDINSTHADNNTEEKYCNNVVGSQISGELNSISNCNQNKFGMKRRCSSMEMEDVELLLKRKVLNYPQRLDWERNFSQSEFSGPLGNTLRSPHTVHYTPRNAVSGNTTGSNGNSMINSKNNISSTTNINCTPPPYSSVHCNLQQRFLMSSPPPQTTSTAAAAAAASLFNNTHHQWLALQQLSASLNKSLSSSIRNNPITTMNNINNHNNNYINSNTSYPFSNSLQMFSKLQNMFTVNKPIHNGTGDKFSCTTSQTSTNFHPSQLLQNSLSNSQLQQKSDNKSCDNIANINNNIKEDCSVNAVTSGMQSPNITEDKYEITILPTSNNPSQQRSSSRNHMSNNTNNFNNKTNNNNNNNQSSKFNISSLI